MKNPTTAKNVTHATKTPHGTRRANPFDQYDLDPLEGPAGITARLRELAEEAASDAERAAIREDWERLTMHPRGRLDAAFDAHPETRPPVGARPRPARRSRSAKPSRSDLQLRDLAALPSVASALTGVGTQLDFDTLPDVPLDEDPILTGRTP